MMASQPNERFPVWNALSEFFVDTELKSDDHERIAEVLAKSTYSIEELEAILRYEVYPECKGNALDVAGEWTGFHPDWIMERIAPRRDKRPRFAMPPLLGGIYRDHWVEVSRIIERKRSAAM